jgi:hypothetical protein
MNKKVTKETQEIILPIEKVQRVPETISHTEAIKLTRKKSELSEAQRANVEKLVELNKQKSETKRLAKEEEKKKLDELILKTQQKELEEKSKVKLVVRPKAVYKKRIVKTIEPESEESEEESEESEEEIIQPKPKKIIRKVEQSIKTIEKIDNVLNAMAPKNRYLSMLKF